MTCSLIVWMEYKLNRSGWSQLNWYWQIESKVGLVLVQFRTRRLSKFSINMRCVWNYALGNSHKNAAMHVMQGMGGISNMNIIHHLPHIITGIVHVNLSSLIDSNFLQRSTLCPIWLQTINPNKEILLSTVSTICPKWRWSDLNH